MTVTELFVAIFMIVNPMDGEVLGHYGCEECGVMSIEQCHALLDANAASVEAAVKEDDDFSEHDTIVIIPRCVPAPSRDL